MNMSYDEIVKKLLIGKCGLVVIKHELDRARKELVFQGEHNRKKNQKYFERMLLNWTKTQTAVNEMERILSEHHDNIAERVFGLIEHIGPNRSEEIEEAVRNICADAKELRKANQDKATP